MPRPKKKASSTFCTINTSLGEIPFFLTRSSRRRTIEITIEETADVRVKAPRYAAEREIREFICEKSDWIIKKIREVRFHQAKMSKRGYEQGHEFWFLGKKYPLTIQNSQRKYGRISFDNDQFLVEVPHDKTVGERPAFIKEKLVQWYRQQAEELLGSRLFHYSRVLGLGPQKIAVRTQKRIWGSCSKTQQRIHLNWYLIMAPLPVIDYVVVHELCHLEVANHSARFWKKVAKILPDYKIRQKWLGQHTHDMVLP